ncbi:hypothetical protein ACWDRB_54900 [Nonomuraea sp. NPDC003707]
MKINHNEPTFNGYSTRYGYFEMRAKGPNTGGGGHTAWWMVGTQDEIADGAAVASSQVNRQRRAIGRLEPRDVCC